MGETPLSVNQVDNEGRIYLPVQIRDRYKGEQMAMYEPEPGKIVMERVVVNE